MAQMVDMTGRKVGKWKVLHRMPPVKNTTSGAVFWMCECECGTIREINGCNLRKGDSNSCGCNIVKPEEFIGTKRGSLTIKKQMPLPEEDVPINHLNASFWLCECECGNEVILSRPTLTLQRDCGCLKADKEIKVHRYTRIGKALSMLTNEQKEEIKRLNSEEKMGEILIGKKMNINPHIIRKYLKRKEK